MPKKQKTRGDHEGSIGKRADGTWHGAIMIRGKRRWVYGKKRSEVADKLGELRKQYRVDGSSDRSKQTIEQFIRGWLLSEVKPNRANATYARYKTHAEKRIYPLIGSHKISAFSPEHVEDFYADLRHSTTTANASKTAKLFTNAMRYAVRKKVIPNDPSAGITKPQHDKSDGEGIEFWTEQEVRTFLEVATETRLAALYVVAIGTGMRQGELFALRWSDVDLDERKISVRRSLEEVAGRFEFRPAKAKSIRVISVGKKVVDALKEHQIEMETEGTLDELVFVSLRGGFLRKSNFQRRQFDPTIKKAGVPKIGFHGLRHTHATQLLANDVNVKVVSERLGHKSIRITLDTYAHVLPAQDESAADAIEGML